jgi:hypothetical protein
MKTNVSSFDAAGRFLLGWSFLFMGIHGFGWWALLGLWPIFTGAIGYCPLYVPLHIDTMAWENAHEIRHHRDHDPRK